MRVISGVAGGIRLEAPKSMARPSTDRLREALFSILQHRVAGARVLDLFAGSGALGIEALSRGAAEATFVDQNRASVAAIKANLERTRLGEGTEVVARDVFRWLGHAQGEYDLVLADPPYVKAPGDRDVAAVLMAAPPLHTLLDREGLVIVETGQERAPKHGDHWGWLEVRSYGRSHLHFFTPAG